MFVIILINPALRQMFKREKLSKMSGKTHYQSLKNDCSLSASENSDELVSCITNKPWRKPDPVLHKTERISPVKDVAHKIHNFPIGTP